MLSRTTLQVKGTNWLGNPTGTFGIYSPANQSIHYIGTCRDVLRWYWEYENPYEASSGASTFRPVINPYLSISCGQPWDMTSFAKRLREIEVRLKVKRYSQVHRTNHPGTTIIHLSAFWLANDTRRSLVSLLMRMFVISPKARTLSQAIAAYPRARPVKAAIQRFMRGYVQPSYDVMPRAKSGYTGFCSTFARRSDAGLKKLLVKPTD